jgi:sec-independent protein translocase protein TatC
MSNGAPKDPDDFFAESRMSFGDHLEELRAYLWRAVAGFGVALFLSLFIGHYVVKFITSPVEDQLRQFQDRQNADALAKVLDDPEVKKLNQPTPPRDTLVHRGSLETIIRGINKGESTEKINEQLRPVVIESKEIQEQKQEAESPNWARRIWNAVNPFATEKPKPPPQPKGPEGKEPIKVKEQDVDKEFVRLPTSIADPMYSVFDIQRAQAVLSGSNKPTTLNVQEAFMVWFKVCMVCGIVIGSPWIFWQIWMFVAAGLYPHEKRLVHVYLPFSLFLFLAGVAVCEFLVIPRAISALLWFNEWMGLKPDIRLNEWLSFAIWMPVIFGICFQTPLVMLFLHKLGIVSLDGFRAKRRMAWFLMAILAAVITPSTDAFSMLFLWVPMSLLFELGLILIRFSPREPDLDVEESETKELVEV